MAWSSNSSARAPSCGPRPHAGELAQSWSPRTQPRSGPGATARSAPTAHLSTARPDQQPTDPNETADVVTAIDLFHWYKAGELRTGFERPTDRSGSASDVLVAEYHLGHVPEEPTEERAKLVIDVTDAHGERFCREVTSPSGQSCTSDQKAPIGGSRSTRSTLSAGRSSRRAAKRRSCARLGTTAPGIDAPNGNPRCSAAV